MSRPSDYRGEMFNATISDREIESLLTGSPAQNGDLSDLAGFVEMLRAFERLTPSEDAVERFATAAAAQVRAAHAPTAAPSLSRDRMARRPLGLRPQVAAMLTTVLLIAGSTGVAVAADTAAPGDRLYWLDRTVENIGIGDGKADERLEEARVLVTEGQPGNALTHVLEALDAADDDVAQARTAIDAAIEDLETAGPAIDEQVTALLDYLSENIGQGIGADGREFGLGVAELARGITSDDETEVTEPAGEPAPSSGDQPEDDAGTNGGPGTGNGDSAAPGNGNGNSAAPGNGNGNPDPPGNPGNGNGNPDPPGNPGNGNGNGNESGNTNPDPPGTADPPESSNPDPSGNGNGQGNGSPPGNGSGNGNGGGQGTGPPPESPSASAPGQVKKP